MTRETRDTGRFAIGRDGSDERRLFERKAIVNAYLGIAIGAVQAELDSGWIGAEHSPLGKSAHEGAVVRRIARHTETGEGPLDAAIVAGRHLLTLDAIADECFRPVPLAGRITRALRALTRPARNDNSRGGLR